MGETKALKPNTFFVEVSGAGLPEVDGLFVPSIAPPAKSESGTLSSLGYWNGKLAWDRADGKAARSPSLSYSNTYKSWRISRLDGHLAYEITCEDELPPTDREWNVYKKGVAPAPKVVLHYYDPRQPCPKPNVVFVLGGPGAGKGTMCELAESQLGWTHLSTGDLLRAELESGGPTAALIQKFVTAGKLVPNEITVTLLKNTMERVTRTTGKKNFLLDGFPRSLSNLEAWHEVFGRETNLPKMLYFECPYVILEKRILGRARYTGRSDDNVESLKLRFDTFKAETLPTVDYFKSQNKCVEVDTSQDRQTVYALVRHHLADYTDSELAAQPLTERAEILLGLRPYLADDGIATELFRDKVSFAWWPETSFHRAIGFLRELGSKSLAEAVQVRIRHSDEQRIAAQPQILTDAAKELLVLLVCSQPGTDWTTRHALLEAIVRSEEFSVSTIEAEYTLRNDPAAGNALQKQDADWKQEHRRLLIREGAELEEMRSFAAASMARALFGGTQAKQMADTIFRFLTVGQETAKRIRRERNWRLTPEQGAWLESVMPDNAISRETPRPEPAPQFEACRQRGDNFWLYVVEHALSEPPPPPHCFKNPVASVTSYRFDKNWRQLLAAGE